MRVLFFLLFVLTFPALAQTDDGIPDNCKYQYGEFYRPNLFPRYEPQNRRLVLVDWTTGADVSVLAADIPDTLIQSWSVSCRYLAVSTGSYESRDTVVYDTVDNRAVGSVPDAYAVPHPLTWGPADFLMVEGRNGAVLWNVPQNIQYPLSDVGYNTTSNRNFRRLRWDIENYELTANLAVGGRVVYDLKTGQPTVSVHANPGELVFGGERFACIPNRNQGGANLSGLSLNYARDGQVLYLGNAWGSWGESLATLEANVPPLYRSLGWSQNCRYVAGALYSPGQSDTYDTVIWDVLEGRRVGMFPDAREIFHRLSWGTAEKHVLVETRDGATLWNLETNERVRVTETVKEPPFNCRYTQCQPRSFEQVYWDAGRKQMLAVPVQTTNAVVAYDVITGVEVERYVVDNASSPLQFITSPDSRHLAAYVDTQVHVWDRQTGAKTVIPVAVSPFEFSYVATISTDSRYLAVITQGVLKVWDLASGAAAPVYTYSEVWGGRIYFVSADTLELNDYPQRRINVVTGERFYSSRPFDAQSQQVQTFSALNGQSGYGKIAAPRQPQCSVAVRYNGEKRQLLAHDAGREWVVEANLNRVRTLRLSPDCQTVYADVQTLNTSLPYDETPGNEGDWYRRYGQLFFWDVKNGERIATLDYTYRDKQAFSGVLWNPAGDRALAVVRNGLFFIHPASRTVSKVEFLDHSQTGYLPRGTSTYWDYGRGLVYVNGYGEVFAFDIQTGQERLRFPVTEQGSGGCYDFYYTGCGMRISDDVQWIFAYGDERLSVWNIDTLINYTVPVSNHGRFSLISPDGRYLIIAYTALRVWDLQNLPADIKARQPIATYDIGGLNVTGIRFADDKTLEVTTGTVTTQYDLLTGSVK